MRIRRIARVRAVNQSRRGVWSAVYLSLKRENVELASKPISGADYCGSLPSIGCNRRGVRRMCKARGPVAAAAALLAPPLPLSFRMARGTLSLPMVGDCASRSGSLWGCMGI